MKLIRNLILSILILSSIIFGQNNYIKTIHIHSVNNEIMVNPQLNDFFNEDILSAVNSGLNISFHFYFELYDEKNNLLNEQESQVNVRNDIWENQYLLTSFNLVKKFKDFEDFKKFLFDSISIKLNSTKKIKNSKNLQLNLTFSPQKITSSQKGKLKNWLKNEEQDSESSLSLNLTKLISFFITEDKNENISIYKSKIFTKNSVSSNASIKK